MFWKPKKSKLQESIDTANEQLDNYDADSPEYDKILSQIERLTKLLNVKTEKSKVSPDAKVAAVVSIATILIIVSYEHLHPIVSKALPFVPKS